MLSLRRAFYEHECIHGRWSVRQLQRQLGSLLYERTGLSTDRMAVVARARKQERQQTIDEVVRDPYVLEFTGLAKRPVYLESDLEGALLEHLQAFLLELGDGAHATCSRMNFGMSAGSKWQRTASRTAARKAGRSSASVTMDGLIARAE